MNVTANTQRSLWLTFVGLGFFWGSSYIFIKIGLDAGLTPFTLVAGRLLVGSILLGTVLFFAHHSLPRDARMYVKIAILAFFAIALPFLLITIAEQHVPSALAATLTAPVPLFAILFAAAMLAERITPAKIAGIVVGLIGVAVLMGFDPAQIGKTDLTYQLVLVGAAVSYGFGGVFARRYVTQGQHPMVTSFIEVTTAMLMALLGSILLENPVGEITSLPPNAFFAVLWLGVFGSGLAYLAFFRLIGAWGPTRTSLVAYLLPVWGIALGFIVLHEPIQSGLIVGTALVIIGIAFVNLNRESIAGLRSRVRGRQSAQAVEEAAESAR